MGRRGRGTPLDLSSIGVYFGREQEEKEKARQERERETARAAIDELRARLDKGVLTAEAGGAAPIDPDRRKRIAEIAASSLRGHTFSSLEQAEALVLKAIETERGLHEGEVVWEFQRQLRQSYDLVSIPEIYDALVGAGLVTKEFVQWWGTHDFLVHPVSATAAVRDFFVREMRKLLPSTRCESQLDTVLAVAKACKGRPLIDVRRDILEAHSDFSEADFTALLTDPSGRGFDAANHLVSGYGPFSISKRSSTSHTVVLNVSLPRGIAVELIRRYVEVIQPFVRQHNAQKRPQFNLQQASKFHMAAQAVPHFLGRKCDETRRSKKYDTIRALNVAKTDGDRDVRRCDIHVGIVPGNAQCVGAVYVNAPLNKHQRNHIEAVIKEVGGNDEEFYWSPDDL